MNLIDPKKAWQFEQGWHKDQKPVYEIDVSRLNKLVADWTLCAKEISGHCRHRYAGECVNGCRGIMICDVRGLKVIN